MYENRRQGERLTNLPDALRRISISNSAGDHLEADVINLHPSGARIEVQRVATFLSGLSRGENVRVHFDGADITVTAMLVYLETTHEKTACGLYFLKPYEQNQLHDALSNFRRSGSANG